MMPAIGDYAVIGDGRAAALISRAGAIDWLCWPRFDSPSLLGGLLDEDGGHFRIAPTTAFESRRAYVEGTNVLTTTFETPTGRVVLTDLMPVASEEDKRHAPLPEHEILRVVACERGEVELAMAFAPRPEYGRRCALSDGGALGCRVAAQGGVAILRSDVALAGDSDGRGVRARLLLRAGERACFSLSFASDAPALLPPLGLWTQRTVARSIDWWHAWSRRMTYDGAHGDAVLRSALALKLLVYAPSGAVVAAATTSLPERLGGDLNWDYRFSWLRDASLTVRALLGLGYVEEAEAFVGWLLHSTRLTRPRLRVLYDVYGNRPGRERTIDKWSGYRGSRPVRIGNAADLQLQLDVYGEVVDAAARLARAGARFDGETQAMLLGFGDYVCAHWREPDEGIWEPRSGRAPHTHSRLLCWTALDRLIELQDQGLLRRRATEKLRDARAAIRRELVERAWSAARTSYVATLGGDDVDAALLLLSLYGFEEAAGARMRGTYARICAELGAGDGLLYRYRSGESPGEGAFGVCSFWGAEHLALDPSTLPEAQRLLGTLVHKANDVGLFAEEIDPESGAALGNFPQAFTHIGLINAALTVAQKEQALARAAAAARPGATGAHP